MNRHVFIVAVLGLAGLAHAQDKYDLRPIFKQGQTSRYKLTQTEVTRATIAGLPNGAAAAPQESMTEIAGEITWKVTEANDSGGGTAAMTIDTLSMKVTGPDGTVVDVTPTRAPEEGKPLQQWLKAMMGTPLTVEVTPDGKIGSVKGYKAIQQKAGDNGAKLDEDYFREIAMDLAVLVGGKADAAPGSSWKFAYTGDHRLGKIDYDMTYTVGGVETIANIPVVLVNRTARMKFNADLSDLPKDAPPMKVTTKEATQTAQIMFDTTRHEIVGINIDQVLDVQVGMTLAGHNITRGNREATSTQIMRIAEK
jgi:hypothetical protein